MNIRERKFVETVWEYYRRHGRQGLPWRRTRNPYRILVSEIMLQQTQVDRVVPKYRDFLKQFPTFAVLAQASLGDVLRAWQGLGYNRRAKMLHECAKVVVEKFRGLTPKSHAELMSLPGIGPYTAGAVMAFAYNVPIPIIETNIRSVYLHHFFHDDTDVPDTEILRMIMRTLDHENSREWYYALMDYGVYVKKTFGNPNSKSKHYTKQSTFKGSDRQIRGAVIRLLTTGPQPRTAIIQTLKFEDIRIDAQLEKLKGEHLVMEKRGKYMLPH